VRDEEAKAARFIGAVLPRARCVNRGEAVLRQKLFVKSIGSAFRNGISRTRHTAPRDIDVKAAERCAPIVDHGCAQPSAGACRRRLRTMVKAQRSPRVRVVLPAERDTPPAPKPSRGSQLAEKSGSNIGHRIRRCA
jgi:hypothetical protein